MDQDVVGKVRIELHQQILAAKVCGCGERNPWNADRCRCGAGLPGGVTVKEDRGMVAWSEEEVGIGIWHRDGEN